MRATPFRIGFASAALFALLAVTACATSEDAEATPPTSDDTEAGAIPTSDAAVNDAGSNDSAANDAATNDAATVQCSEAGWCDTALPDPNTTITDLSPLPGHAFALASVSYAATTKVLEWDDTVGHWVYIDDSSQNLITQGSSSNIWAPNKDEVYFTIVESGTAHATYVFHGTRSVPPASAWSWTQTKFDCATTDGFPQVWGTSSDDVYLWTCQTIRHKTSASASDAGPDAGAASWVTEYVNDDPADPINMFGMAATSPDDVWFVGGRGFWLLAGCSTILRRTGAGYQRVVDSTGGFFDCTEKPGIPMITGTFASDLGMDAFFLPAKGQLVGVQHSLTDDNQVMRIDVSDDGSVAVKTSTPATGVRLSGGWGATGDDVWLLANRNEVSFVLRGKNLWSDAGTVEQSTMVRNGLPNLSQLYRLRGTSNSNLWAVGTDHAYHKSTP